MWRIKFTERSKNLLPQPTVSGGIFDFRKRGDQWNKYLIYSWIVRNVMVGKME